MKPETIDVLIVGAGAAGMMCAIEAGRRGRSVRLIDHARAPGEKIRISGGGRCNFTNLGTGPANFLGENPRFATSALKRFSQHDFVKRVDRAGIAWHEKTLGQLFCDDSAKQIIRMLTDDLRAAGAVLSLGVSVERVDRIADGYEAALSDGTTVRSRSLVLATGGKSIPKMGATGWAYDAARQFGLRVTDTRPALVPLTFEAGLLETLKPLAGVAVDVSVSAVPASSSPKGDRPTFNEAMLFTHRGLSGPAILQISSYWREGEAITVAMAPGEDLHARLKAAKEENGKQMVHTALGHLIPRRLAESVCDREAIKGKLAEVGDKTLRRLDAAVNGWTVKPVGSEGYRTAEVTLGGIATDQLDQQTMEARSVPGLYVIGEAADVTGWLGGYNFQWAWSSGWAAGQAC
ncbi:MAG: NAD(P)/FAD-dependent oxidoreductase [Alphaproteobacteria bacterium]|jgi:predicted Rossmann fold flavoprotein|nr:NAD(P)/FAD-dependent oxidoreductase [Alphaproteobacteria bacterium]MBU2043128.1 NAD(P)/FAD-dependent oxidoreductase [Alphaproteobacteria bacterium]MBU2124458.1 NAD(P)/FAD-dependent oxidoreductase [Alphaproteobacteria bacterium]MBU2207692.1 NAD(P)/FAD-dependent oxidoreductase [Alphaproteobacteria bacterium]